MIFPSVKERETAREKGLSKSATVASKSALYLVLICLFDYLFMHLFVFALCFRQHLEWRTEEKGADSRARGNKIRYYGMHVYVCVCVDVDQLWQNMWKDEKRMTAIIPAHTAHWSPPNAIQSQSSCSAVAPLWMPDQDTHRILTSLILSEISDAISDLFSGWNIRTQLGRHIHFSYGFFSQLKEKKKLIQSRFHSVVFRQSIQSCLHLGL